VAEYIKLDADFKILTDYYRKKLSKKSILNSVRFKKISDGKKKVFHIGIPGKASAMCISILLIIAFYLSTASYNIFMWVMYILLILLCLPLSFKVDKVIQIRTLAMSLACESRKLLEEVCKDFEHVNGEKIDKIKQLLIESTKYVYEPSVEKQIKLLDDFKM
jgi:hypothetical protein